jgi:hypothetical protein
MTKPAKGISKSQYIRGLQCEKSLWFYRNRKELATPVDEAKQAVFDQGNEVGEYAKKYFPDGVEVSAKHFEIELAAEQTLEFISGGSEVLFEACAISPDGLYSRIDVLQKCGDQWDLIEVKSSTKVADYHLDDMASQRFAFEGAGFKIRKSILMHIDNSFVKEGPVDASKLFHLEDCTAAVTEQMVVVRAELPRLLKVLEGGEEPEVGIGAHCSKPFSCDYKEHCWAHVPEYSVYNVASGKKLLQLTGQGILDARDIPDDFAISGAKGLDLAAYKAGQSLVDAEELGDFLSELKYPLYYLDYETVGINIPVPFIDGTSPYRQVPFQYSLHIQCEAGGELVHKEFLFEGSGDPRAEFTASLAKDMEGSGSVVVYNGPFEASVNRELAKVFPEYKSDLEDINARMVDLLIPFRKRHLYHPAQKSSASIKAVLPAFCPDMSYDNLEIGDGGSASRLYTQILKGSITGAQKAKILKDLRAYCEQDTLAMVRLIEVIYQKVPGTRRKR